MGIKEKRSKQFAPISLNYLRGIHVTQEALLKEGTKHNIPDLVKQVDLPVYFVMGKFDYMTSVNAAKKNIMIDWKHL